MVKLSPFSEVAEISHLENGLILCINSSVLYLLRKYPQSMPSSWLNVSENNLHTNIMGSAFGVLCQLPINMFPKEENSFTNTVCLPAMSLGIRHCSGEAFEAPPAPIITLCSLHTKQNRLWIQITFSQYWLQSTRIQPESSANCKKWTRHNRRWKWDRGLEIDAGHAKEQSTFLLAVYSTVYSILQVSIFLLVFHLLA